MSHSFSPNTNKRNSLQRVSNCFNIYMLNFLRKRSVVRCAVFILLLQNLFIHLCLILFKFNS